MSTTEQREPKMKKLEQLNAELAGARSENERLDETYTSELEQMEEEIEEEHGRVLSSRYFPLDNLEHEYEIASGSRQELAELEANFTSLFLAAAAADRIVVGIFEVLEDEVTRQANNKREGEST